VNGPLDGRAAFVTGGAAGIGAAIVAALSAAGARVHAADLAWGADPAEPPAGVTPVELDVTDRGQIDAALDALVSAEGRLDVLVNNAGVMRSRDFFEYTPEDWGHVLKVNAEAVFFCQQAAARRMIDLGAGGSVVNIASVAGRDGRTLSPPYAASKAAVISLTRSTARRLAPHGIRVNAVCPGIIDTEFNVRLGRQYGPAEGLTPEEFVARRTESVPLARLGTPAEVAAVACFLASDAASYVTGQSINVDGGLVMS
jgi:NAD(P)-dependent dehydrogenase (short-subunit alcohol dehydrogenase family)